MKMVIAPDMVRPMLLKRLSARRLVSSSILKFTCAMVLFLLCFFRRNYTRHLIAMPMVCYTTLAGYPMSERKQKLELIWIGKEKRLSFGRKSHPAKGLDAAGTCILQNNLLYLFQKVL